MRTRDTQRSKLYAWEATVPEGERLSLDACRELVHAAYEAYGLSARPMIRDGRGTTVARGDTTWVNLPVWARCQRTVLHEAAHGVTILLSPGSAWHGPEFTAVLINLWERFKLGHGPDLRRSARTAKLKVSQAPACKASSRTATKRLAAAVARRNALWQQLREAEAELVAAHAAVRGG